ncbi:MAG TPA: phosphoketolase family protein [Candidatus Paceibacterota bacterium]|nr:phosphoketolase family protein [Candidatus Paceibacterota bacterium]HRZ34432.1 phosphoketolase family protein [Candidatus Paceibacterota bacterium]
MRENFEKYFRAANYLSVAQIFLQDNFLMEQPLKPEHIKPRLLGHWGTCPGINFVYMFLNKLAKDHGVDLMYVVGPGHGYPAVQANLFIEGTLSEYYPNAKRDAEGVAYISKQFSWPYGFPSHSSPHTPGVILEGGELGYSLSTSFGAVMDNPDLVVACLVGDGEAETGPTATAWHVNKFISPKTDGAVLPILHLNGYKISGPTVFGRMSDDELQKLFEGYGYQPCFVDKDKGDIFKEMEKTIEQCYLDIKKIQTAARSGKETIKPKWPMIILKTPKGWTGPKTLLGKKIEGNCYSHQVVAKNPRIDKEEFRALENWLRSYKFEELFDKKTGFVKEILDLIPVGDRRIGKNRHAFGGPQVYKPLILPKAEKYEENVSKPGIIGSSSMHRAGEYLNEVFKLNKDNFRFFSPDETYSNKLDKIFETTKRSFDWPLEKWDEDLAAEGRVVEMLSEHTLQGLIQGYVLTGRHGVFASYEAFIQIVASMSDQYAKFLKQAREIPWRGAVPSLNYILTSSGWRQEHNGFSHQNPGFIDNILQRQGDFINVFFPADGSSTLAVLEKSLSLANGMNVIVAGKTLEPRWISLDEARNQLEEGLGIWKFASDDNPDIVFAGVGDYLTKEALAGVQLLKEEIPDIKVRFVNIMTLSASGFGCGGCVLSRKDFHRFFTSDKPVIVNFHGYPQTVKQILFDYGDDPDRFKINGYIENGSTTTPFDMHIRNQTSRYHLLMDACRLLTENGRVDKKLSDKIVEKYQRKLKDHRIYIKKYGVDPEEIENWQWQRQI